MLLGDGILAWPHRGGRNLYRVQIGNIVVKLEVDRNATVAELANDVPLAIFVALLHVADAYEDLIKGQLLTPMSAAMTLL
ncbi:hypothetical protein [Mesorhizobium sp. 10J20-29]